MAQASEKLTGATLAQRQLSELHSLLAGKRDDLRKAMFKHACRELKQTHSIGLLRRDVARLSTVIASKVAKEVRQP